MSTLNYIGIGLDQPLNISGTSQTISGVELITKSIKRILSTPVGSTFFRPEFGSRIHELKFEQNDSVLQSLMTTFIDDAISSWETRVKLESVVYEVSTELLNCGITFRILNSNEIHSFVYPFYRELEP